MVTSPRLSRFPPSASAAVATTPLPLTDSDAKHLQQHGYRYDHAHAHAHAAAKLRGFDEPSPVQNQQPARALTLHPSLYILSWIFFSNCTILFNKWLIDNAGFPILLTCWHLVFATLATQILARTTSLLDSRHSLPIDGSLYIRTILPIGILYSGSLVCSNAVYLYLSVPFIQMLKSAAPVVVLFFSWLWGLADPDVTALVNIVVIVAGVAMASAGEIHFSWVGFLYQVGGTVFEAMRLVMIQVMLSSEGLRVDPLVGLYYYAPVCALMNFVVAFWTELPTFDSLMTLTGILKSILLVITSVLIWSTPISPLQCFGYSTALVGLVYYSLGHDQLVSLFHSIFTWILEAWNEEDDIGIDSDGRNVDANNNDDDDDDDDEAKTRPANHGDVWTPQRRRVILVTGALCFISSVFVAGVWHGPAALRRARDVFPGLLSSKRLSR
ncbi:hypothetical protein GMORB2_3001 [Geosmithia morbida]|uniref:Sugar phosphate transporter domain-containing protein n=1 Tax=Geosmithia morbida TaxID=1094350 RepID=A0A9P4YP56_9HYPO|nr:uncharacterized protein GMORB2_3001 [Geosmithia morbida]KAF4120563.1 hypothetical protein GMORB2_3001 [Geosmithia morbida]